MNRDEFRALLQSVREAGAIRRGDAKPSRVFEFPATDLTALRGRLDLSQTEFAQLIGISVSTLRNWEQGRRRPEGPALALLRLVERDPSSAISALATRQQADVAQREVAEVRSASILDSRLYVRHGIRHAGRVNAAVAANASLKAHFASQLLFYDRIVIPTKDFGIIPILESWGGERFVQRALEAGALAFARPPALLAYKGNGGGLTSYRVFPGPGKPYRWHLDALFGDFETACEVQIRNGLKTLPSASQNALIEAVLNVSKEVSWTDDEFEKYIRHETFTDVIANPFLVAFVISHEPPEAKQNVSLSALSGLDANQIRLLGKWPPKDGIALVLHIAEINFDILMAYRFGDCDICTSAGAETIIAGKLRRAQIASTSPVGFVSPFELSGIPDIRDAVTSGDLSLEQVLKIREKEPARELRHLLAARSGNTKRIRDLYVAGLGRRSRGLPRRRVQFAVTESSRKEFASSQASFFVKNWASGYQPMFYVGEPGPQSAWT